MPTTTRVRCPGCRQQLAIPVSEAEQFACPFCRTFFRVGDTVAEKRTAIAKRVLYLHHTRDGDGDVIFYFREAEGADSEARKSSPLVSLQRHKDGTSVFVDGKLMGHYKLKTKNSEYVVTMSREKADHLAKEIGVSLDAN